MVLLAEGPVPLPKLFSESNDPWHSWRKVVSLWRGLPASQWFGILETMRIRHLGFWAGVDAVTVLDRESGGPLNVGESVGFELRGDIDVQPFITDPYQVEVPAGTVAHQMLRSLALQANGTGSRMALILSPYLKYVSHDLGTWYVDGEERSWIEAHEVLKLRLTTVDQLSIPEVEDRLRAYEHLLFKGKLDSVTVLTLHQVMEDLRAWPPHLGSRIRKKLKSKVRESLNSGIQTTGAAPAVRESFQRLHGEILTYLDQDANGELDALSGDLYFEIF